MCTIIQQSQAIINHPYFKRCLELAGSGDMSGFERLFYEVQSHVWEINSLQASRVYGQWHRANHCDIKREIRDCPPPNNLDLRLPFVPKTIALPPKLLLKIVKLRPKPCIENHPQLFLTFI